MRRPHPRTGSGLSVRRLYWVVLLGFFAACGSPPELPATTAESASPAPAKSAPATSAPASAAPVVTIEPTVTPSAESINGDGKYFVELASVEPSKSEAHFDVAQFLTGEAAQKAAKEDGAEVDNDYYIRNKSKTITTMGLASDVSVRLVDWDHCCNMKDSDLAILAKYFETGARYDSEHGGSGPFFITVKDGKIQKIEEQYLP